MRENQKVKIARNKYEFVEKMLPVVDEFRAAKENFPPTTDREEKMHRDFGSLLDSILLLFEKYGYKEFDAGNFAVSF